MVGGHAVKLSPNGPPVDQVYVYSSKAEDKLINVPAQLGGQKLEKW
jgi:hypothetical protein